MDYLGAFASFSLFEQHKHPVSEGPPACGRPQHVGMPPAERGRVV